eukprot:1757827-Amphidinium_carterae.1
MHIFEQQWAVLVGGVCPTNAGARAPIEVRNLQTNAAEVWHIHCTDGYLLSHNHASVATATDLFLLGGGGICFSFGLHVNSAVVRLSWHALRPCLSVRVRALGSTCWWRCKSHGVSEA